MDWDGWKEKCHKNHKRLPCCEDQMCPCDLEEFNRLQKENARLREALVRIATWFPNAKDKAETVANLQKVAAAALEGK